METCHCLPFPAMSLERPGSQKSQLAIAIANGKSIVAWARVNKVPERTAYRWSRDPKVLAAVESYRRRSVDQAIGRMARRVTWATDGIAKLARSAESEPVRLAALRSILSDMIGITKFADLEQRITEIEGQLDERTESARRPG